MALMHPKDVDEMANSVDPDQTASSEAVWSWSALFAETYLSQYIEFVRYIRQVSDIKSDDLMKLLILGRWVIHIEQLYEVTNNIRQVNVVISDRWIKWIL